MTLPIDKMLDAVEWTPIQVDVSRVTPGAKYATHQAVLTIAGVKLRCFVLNTGERVFDADDVAAFFGCASADEFQEEMNRLTGK